MVAAEVPKGVILRDLTTCEDHRGALTEVFRARWAGEQGFVQWNFVETTRNTMRGVHVHPTHSDYLVVLKGRLLLGLRDLRRTSPTFGSSALIDLRGERLQGVFVPPGVAHGFYFPDTSLYIYGVTDYWNLADELGCQWNDPELSIQWPAIDPVVSERDQFAPTLQCLMELLDAEYGDAPMMAMQDSADDPA